MSCEEAPHAPPCYRVYVRGYPQSLISSCRHAGRSDGRREPKARNRNWPDWGESDFAAAAAAAETTWWTSRSRIWETGGSGTVTSRRLPDWMKDDDESWSY